MDSSQTWRTDEDFLALFGIDTQQQGAQDFLALTTATALFLRFPSLGCGFYDASRRRLRELRWSPVVFYGRIKRALRPIFEADRATLAALGLVIEAEVLTVPVLAQAVARVIADSTPEDAFPAAQRLAVLCMERPTKGGGNGGE